MLTPLPWITDRLPTAADGDKDGDVIALLHGDKTWCSHRWNAVKRGQPWLAFAPHVGTSSPEPAPSTPTPLTRRIISITRTVQESGDHTIDAVADDGTAWWRIAGVTDDWTQLPALPKREAEELL